MKKLARFLLGSSLGMAVVALTLAVSPRAAHAEGCPDPASADDIRCQFHNGGQSLTCCYWSGSSFLGCCTLNAE